MGEQKLGYDQLKGRPFVEVLNDVFNNPTAALAQYFDERFTTMKTQLVSELKAAVAEAVVPSSSQR
jgi:hypothetical protein